MAPRAAFRATSTPGATVGRTVVGAGVDVAVGDVAGLAVSVAVADGAPYPPRAAEPGLPHAASSAGARISSKGFLIGWFPPESSHGQHRRQESFSRARYSGSARVYWSCCGARLGRQPGGAVVRTATRPAG